MRLGKHNPSDLVRYATHRPCIHDKNVHKQVLYWTQIQLRYLLGAQNNPSQRFLKELIIYVSYCFISINNRLLVVRCYSSLVVSGFSTNEFNSYVLFNFCCFVYLFLFDAKIKVSIEFSHFEGGCYCFLGLILSK